MENKKYELTNETMEYEGYTLHRIKALYSFNDVVKGDLGGWVESENNLSQSGDCWIYNNGMVMENAIVYDNATVCYNSKVFGDAKVYGNVEVHGNAKVYGNAKVSDNAIVHGNAKVYGNARVFGDAEVYNKAKVLGNARVFGNASISGMAMIIGDAEVYNKAKVWGNARVYNKAKVWGNAKVYGNAEVCDKAMIFGDSDVCDKAKVCDNAKVYNTQIFSNTTVEYSTHLGVTDKIITISNNDQFKSIDNIGSRHDTTTFFKDIYTNIIYVVCGCFSGTIDEFKERVIETHGDNKYAEQYLGAIEYIKKIL